MNPLTKIRYSLALIIALMFSAIFCLSFPYEGTSIAKYFNKQAELERVKEADIQAYSDQTLFGDALKEVPEDIELLELADSDEAFVSAERVRLADRAIIAVLTLSAWLMLVPALVKRRFLSWIYLILGLYLIALSITKGINGGAMFAELAVPAHATRWLSCVAMWGWLFFINKKAETKDSLKPITWLLKVAIALTFAIHGYEAFCEHPKFKDLLYGAAVRFNIELSESANIALLKIIGVKDILLAIAVLCFLPRWKWILLWMTFWGFITAASRPITFGDVGWCDALLRVGNGALPLIIYIIFTITQKPEHHEQT